MPENKYLVRAPLLDPKQQVVGYKLAWRGGELRKRPAAWSSCTCADCGHVDAASRVSQAAFVCTGCGVVKHADVNAAQVMLQRGLAVEPTVTGCGGPAASRPAKQQLRTVRRGNGRFNAVITRSN